VRTLLAHRKEINRLRGNLDQQGLTLIPLNIQLKGSWIKLVIGLAKGRKLHDKRQEERRKQDEKDLRSALKRL
jgi:SsrA-binding protein